MTTTVENSKKSIDEKAKLIREAFKSSSPEKRAELFKLIPQPIASESELDNFTSRWDQSWEQNWPQSFVQGW